VAKSTAKKTIEKKPAKKKPIESYDHKGKKRANNPPQSAECVLARHRQLWFGSHDVSSHRSCFRSIAS